MTPHQKKQQEDFFKMILNHSKVIAHYVWPDANASYKIVDGKFQPNDARSRKAMMTTTGKTFHNEFMIIK